MILFAAGAFLVAMYSDSETMSLEAMSAIVDIVVAGLAVFVARKVKAPANRRFQFGYAKYEPLMTTVEGILVAGVCTAARSSTPCATSCIPIPSRTPTSWSSTRPPASPISVAFGTLDALGGPARGIAPRQTEAELWIVEGWLALGVCAAFVVGIVLGRMGMTQASAYVDPSCASRCRCCS